ncbi:hypothetical protein NP493_1g09021 [Ridgeia piscesae]|uniref:Uncharacterized protein n=1 Tax=Ridgeia piscesae TaxID=27915 RepID=A0AAD9PGV1_RIDPI|nr:hypothetical protein NP493_1g09021 [Ridgeia piscesae]
MRANHDRSTSASWTPNSKWTVVQRRTRQTQLDQVAGPNVMRRMTSLPPADPLRKCDVVCAFHYALGFTSFWSVRETPVVWSDGRFATLLVTESALVCLWYVHVLLVTTTIVTPQAVGRHADETTT